MNRRIANKIGLWRAKTGLLGTLFFLALLLWAGTAAADDSHIPATSPAVLSYSPEANAVQFPVNGVISVVWDRPMQPNSDFSVTGPEGFVPGSFEYNPDTYTVTFLPDQDLTPDTRYGVLVAGQVDIDGQVQEGTVQWNFDTVAPTSVSLVTFTSEQSLQSSWWWAAWPWLMAVVSLSSLGGFLLLWGRRLWRTSRL